MSSQLIAVLVAVQNDTPKVLTLGAGRSLPAGPLESRHRSLQNGMRLWVEQQTGRRLGHIEQLYTFADTQVLGVPEPERSLLISYLALTHADPPSENWRSWYEYFPWEDQMRAQAQRLVADITLRLKSWVGTLAAEEHERQLRRVVRLFGGDGEVWDDQLVLQRYELLWEAGMVRESPLCEDPVAGMSMDGDHRRILATGIARLRAKIRYRPVFYEFMDETFTLSALQRTVEVVAGQAMHTQNFRRLIAQQNLIEETPDYAPVSRGRPAKLFRFRREMIEEGQIMGSKLPIVFSR